MRRLCAAMEVLKVLVDLGADVNTVDHFGWTATVQCHHHLQVFSTACCEAKKKICKRGTLVHGLLSMDPIDGHGMTALMYAVEGVCPPKSETTVEQMVAPYCTLFLADALPERTNATMVASR